MIIDYLYSAIIPSALSKILSGQAELRDFLASIPFVTVGVVGLEYKAVDVIPQEYREVCIVCTSAVVNVFLVICN